MAKAKKLAILKPKNPSASAAKKSPTSSHRGTKPKKLTARKRPSREINERVPNPTPIGSSPFNDIGASADTLETLHERVKEPLKEQLSEDTTTNLDVHQLFHELQAHQVELEMQIGDSLKAQAEAEATAKHYTEHYDSAPVGCLSLGRKGEILQTNFAAAALLGTERVRLIGKRLTLFVMTPDIPTFNTFLAQVYAGAHGEICELRLENQAEQGPRVVHLSGILDTHGESSSVIISDITAIRKAEEALIVSEQKFRTVFENSRDALLANSPPNWKFTWANKAAVKLFGAAQQSKLFSLAPWDISPELQPDGEPSGQKAQRMVDTAMREGSHIFEWVHKRMNDSTFPAEVLLTRMEMDGKIFILGSIRDITARKKLDGEIRNRRNTMEMLQKTQVATQTVSAIVHEMNQPLLAIASYAEAALMMLREPNPDTRKISETIEKSKKQALRAGKALRDLLNYLSVKEFSKESFNLNQEIKDVVATVRTEHQLQFHAKLNLEKQLPLVWANRTHVQRVLINLLYNGIDAMQKAGVPLPSLIITVRTVKEHKVAQVTIQDNGPGIQEGDIQRIFEPFFSTKTNGIGMGLAISRSLIEANGGQLWIDPDEGPGATFHLTIPFSA